MRSWVLDPSVGKVLGFVPVAFVEILDGPDVLKETKVFETKQARFSRSFSWLNNFARFSRRPPSASEPSPSANSQSRRSWRISGRIETFALVAQAMDRQFVVFARPTAAAVFSKDAKFKVSKKTPSSVAPRQIQTAAFAASGVFGRSERPQPPPELSLPRRPNVASNPCSGSMCMEASLAFAATRDFAIHLRQKNRPCRSLQAR